MSFVNKETVKVQIEAFRGAQGPAGPAGPQGASYVLTAEDKQEIAEMVGGNGGGSSVELDDTLTQSGKAADAKAVGDAIDVLKEEKANDADLAKVAKSGSYTDLTNKPTIPSAYTLPTASASVLGGVKVGSGLTIDENGVMSLNVSNASGVSF